MSENQIVAHRDYVKGRENHRERSVAARRRPAVAFAARYRNRPSNIRKAIYRAWECADQIGGTKSTIALLQAIVSCVDCMNAFEPVFATKQKLAKIAGIGEASVYRGLARLEKDGWLVRQGQRRDDYGTLEIAELTITNKTAKLLLLVEEEKQTETNNTKEQQPATNNKLQEESELAEDKPISVCVESSRENVETHPEKGQENGVVPGRLIDGLIDGYIYEVDRQVYPKASVNHQSGLLRFVRMDNRSVPAELAWLIHENRLSYGGLFGLMRLAKKVEGQTLTDFVALRTDRLKQLPTTKDCYRYLKNLIDQGLDAKYLVAQARKAEHRVARKHQRDEAAAIRESWLRAHEGLTYQSKENGKTFTINAIHGLAIIGINGRPTNEPSMPITGRFIQAVDSGRLQRFVPVDDSVKGEQARARIHDLKRILGAR